MHLLLGLQGSHLKDSEVIPQARNQGLRKAPQVNPHIWTLLLEPQAMHPLIFQHWRPQGIQLRIPAHIYHQVQL